KLIELAFSNVKRSFLAINFILFDANIISSIVEILSNLSFDKSITNSLRFTGLFKFILEENLEKLLFDRSKFSTDFFKKVPVSISYILFSPIPKYSSDSVLIKMNNNWVMFKREFKFRSTNETLILVNFTSFTPSRLNVLIKRIKDDSLTPTVDEKQQFLYKI
ncbi:hypothetical protein BpHYR1_038299, partial [Brachionus plicatilis]